jgi:hypothetical protein
MKKLRLIAPLLFSVAAPGEWMHCAQCQYGIGSATGQVSRK